MTDRETLRAGFIQHCGWQDATVEPLTPDASFRNYYRLRRGAKTMLVMDCPPDKGEDVRPFVMIDRHLLRLGLSAPVIYNIDETNGFLLLEDFGDTVFTRLLAVGHDEISLYELATDVIIRLQSAPDVMQVDTTSYLNRFVPQSEWMVQWYLPDVTGKPAGELCTRQFYDAWYKVLATLPPPATTLMLRDFHVDNLMLLPDRQGVAACGVLDFQDAEFAPRAYDLVCLLEDARRDVSDDLRRAMLARYSAALPIDDSFTAWYAAIAVQRHMRVIGNFTRQSVSLGRHQYRAYLPRVVGHLKRSLAVPSLAPMRDWAERWLPQLLERGE